MTTGVAITQDESERLVLKLISGTPLQKGAAFLRDRYRSGAEGTGWAHRAHHDSPTVWGGTLDGIRGLLAAGIHPSEPMISGAIQWLYSQQRDEGGWGSREIAFSCVEATAWVIIALREAGIDPVHDQPLQSAIRFLESAIAPDGSVGTSPLDLGSPRLYSSALTLWALRGLSPHCHAIAGYLYTQQHTGGGWGVKPGAPPQAVSTSHALIALNAAGFLSDRPSARADALEFLISRQKPDGSFEDVTEEWFSKHQPNVPNRCDDFGTAWAVQGLLAAGLAATELPVVKATTHLLHRQQSDGSWIFNLHESVVDVWCVADSLVALAAVRRAYLQGAPRLDYSSAIGSRRTIAAAHTSLYERIKIYATPTAIAVVGILASRDIWTPLMAKLASFLSEKGIDIAVNLLASAIWTSIGAITIVVIAKIRKASNKG